MTGFHADRSVLPSSVQRGGRILQRIYIATVAGQSLGASLGFVPRPTTTAAVQLSALNKPAESSGRGRLQEKD